MYLSSGEFIDSGQCVVDKDWCLAYMGEEKGLCKGEGDPIVEYCRKCGFCLSEFSFQLFPVLRTLVTVQ